MKEIPLRSRAGVLLALTVVDDDDYERFARFTWRLFPHRQTSYAVRFDREIRRQRYLHRDLLGLVRGDGLEVDHIDGDGLNNTRVNLRAATSAEQSQNQTGRPGTSSFRGVCWDRSKGRWKAYATLHGRHRYLGHYDDENDAATAAAEWRAEHMPFSREALTT